MVVERAKREGSSYHKVKVRQHFEAKIHKLGELLFYSTICLLR